MKGSGNLAETEVQSRAAARVAAVAHRMGAGLTELATTLHQELADAIPELRGDTVILELLRASTESNVEAFLHVAQHGIAIEEVRPPSAAIEYARRLAQRGISANALLRAYRVGQSRVLAWVVAEVAREEPDREVAFAAAQVLQGLSFAYVDKVAELVVAEYESERERWLANRNSLRAARLAALLAGHDDDDLASAESALGYRLRQHHLGVVAWASEGNAVPIQLRHLESFVADIAEALNSAGKPLFLPQDGAMAWAWIPLGRGAGPMTLDLAALDDLAEQAGATVQVALGEPAASSSGFRSTHEQAVRAHAVASVASQASLRVTSFSDPGVQIASILAQDLTATRRLVATSLGGLACNDKASRRLRETLLAFLGANSSYVATADLVHLHKNTVKYRVDKALEVRGRPLDKDRLNLEIALTACKWLGPTVLVSCQPRKSSASDLLTPSAGIDQREP